MLALYAAKVPKRRLRVAATVILTIVAGVVIASMAGKGTTVAGIAAIADGLLVAVAPPAVVIGLLRALRSTGTVTVPVVAGVLCLYLLVGLFFAFTYAAVQNLGGAPFFANGDAATSARSVYFSFVTMTTVGYGDFTARTNLGHTMAVTEALLGQIYLVTIVAAIVSRVVPRGRKPNSRWGDIPKHSPTGRLLSLGRSTQHAPGSASGAICVASERRSSDTPRPPGLRRLTTAVGEDASRAARLTRHQRASVALTRSG
jgi:hypothetical protein